MRCFLILILAITFGCNSSQKETDLRLIQNSINENKYFIKHEIERLRTKNQEFRNEVTNQLQICSKLDSILEKIDFEKISCDKEEYKRIHDELYRIIPKKKGLKKEIIIDLPRFENQDPKLLELEFSRIFLLSIQIYSESD